MPLRFYKIHGSGHVTVKYPERYRVKWDAVCRSNFQKEVKKFFKKYWSHHQCFEELPVAGTKMRFDLINTTLKIIVESNGMQHDRYNAFFHRGSKDVFLDQVTNDMLKRTWAEKNGYELVEIYEADLPLTPKFIEEKFGIKL